MYIRLELGGKIKIIIDLTETIEMTGMYQTINVEQFTYPDNCVQF